MASKIKDVFGAHLLKNAKYDGYYDIPTVISKIEEFPKYLIPYSETSNKNKKIKPGSYCCFYQHDYLFDGEFGIWNSLIYKKNYSKGFSLKRIEGYSGIITPDYSVYADMPRSEQITQVFRSHAIGYALSCKGYNVIPNVRWGDVDSYDYSFSGYKKNSILSIGSLGCIKSKKDYELFIKGFEVMLNRLTPKKLLIYGSCNKEMKAMLNERKVKYKVFTPQISKAFRGR